MGYLEAKSAPACLRNHYEKLLFPYDVFQSGLMTGDDSGPQVITIALIFPLLKTGSSPVTHTAWQLYWSLRF